MGIFGFPTRYCEPTNSRATTLLDSSKSAHVKLRRQFNQFISLLTFQYTTSKKMKRMDAYVLFKHLVNQKLTRKPARVLGVNHMGKYAGLAVADVDTRRVKSCWVLETKNSNYVAQSFWHLIRKENVGGIVFGLHFDEQAENPRKNRYATYVEKFVKDLSKAGKLDDVPFTFWDDSQSLELVECLFLPFTLDPVVQHKMVDKACTRGAAYVVQTYLRKMEEFRA